MKKRLTYFLAVFLFCLIISNAQNKDQSIKYLKSNLEFLASDELEGREATTRGEKIASLFIAQELNKYGIKPFGDNESYFQNFKMVLISNDEDRSNLTLLTKNGEKEIIKLNQDFVLDKSPLPNEIYSDKKYKVVFAGYGVESEEEDYSDYKNLDVKGKLVVVLPGSPLESQKNLYITKLRNLKEKIAVKHGAAGVLSLIGKDKASFWQMVLGYFDGPSFKLESEVNEVNSNNIPSIILSFEVEEKLFAGEKYDVNKIEELLASKEPVNNYFELEKEIQLDYSFTKETRQARNVVGILEGADENLKNEYVTIGAHYDHLGIHNGQIYNGADDNGSGTTSILELARLMALERKNKRSILFIFHTGEEKGLKGAKYLTSHSNNIINNAVVNINMDMIGRESIDTLFNVGSGRLSTELYNLVREVNSETVNFVLDYKFDSPNDPQNIYNRSDHKHYAEKGIPVVFFFDKMFADYHKPTDTVDKINYNKMYKVVELCKALALKIANLDHKLKVDNNIEMKKDKMEEVN